MTANYNSSKHNFIRLHILCSLIFFAFVFLISCSESTNKAITIVWSNDQAVAISVPKSLLKNFDDNSLNELMQVSVEGRSSAMLGDYTIKGDDILFKPLVPLTRGLGYEIFYRKKLIGIIKVDQANASDAPIVLNVFPTQDTLPENLLKMYVEFSRPMREGESLKHIALLDRKGDTLRNVFLDLQPELWNIERTVLTIWLDPGRIKRELIPNQQLGNPLKFGERYNFVVAESWKDVQGLTLQQPYTKSFVVGNRDSISPDPQKWILNSPTAGTKELLEINFGEPLDYFLLQETIVVADEKNKVIAGRVKPGSEESNLQFEPQQKWSAGRYNVQISSVLEDLAGNNLNKLFDRDISIKKTQADRDFYILSFEVKNKD